MPATRLMYAGPLEIAIAGPAGELRDQVEANLALYDAPWEMDRRRSVALELRRVVAPARSFAQGHFLEAQHMLVDPVPGGLRATTTSGASLEGSLTAEGEQWLMEVPPVIDADGRWPEVEHLLTLVLTTGWRRAGWVPVHCAGIVQPHTERATLVCAGSMGGKTTFTMAMVQRGWLALGDDKLLLRRHAASTVVAAVKHMLNVDPAAAAWFPALGDVYGLPQYSSWTPKRRVALGGIWPDAVALSATAMQLIVLERRPGSGGVRFESLTPGAAIAALLRQSVIPRDSDVARPIIDTLAKLAEGARALRVELFSDAYEHPATLDELEASLRE